MIGAEGAARAYAVRPLVGRDRELSQVGDLVDNVSARGGALVVRGEPGVGKSALLAASIARAREKGLAVHSMAGAESEAPLAFAGLHRLMLPFLGYLEGLPLPQRQALETAFGMAEGRAPDAFMIGVAALGLIAGAAEETPVLLVVDDAHWLDRPSRDALAFVGRRLELEPVLLLLGVRETEPEGLADLGLPEMRLEGLDDSAARALLAETASALAADVQERILRESAGNPLALIELPAAAAGFGDRPGIKPLPLTARLESAFAGRLADVKEDARLLLLLAALEEAPIGTHLQAAEVLLGRAVDVAALRPAAAAGLGRIGNARFEFRHPLVRSAVQLAATAEERRRAHMALARVLAGDPDRSVWHEAAAATGPDEGVASRLERLAERGVLRGGTGVAIAAMQRAATLSPETMTRVRRLTDAAGLSFDIGEGPAGIRLLEEAYRLDLPAGQRARIGFMLEVMRSSTWSGTEGIRAYIRAARDLLESGGAEDALFGVHLVAHRAHWSNLDDGMRGELVAIVEHLAECRSDPQFLMSLALIDPAGHGGEILAQVRQRTPVAEENPYVLFFLGTAAAAVWSPNLALPFTRAAVEWFRAYGSPGVAGEALTFVAWDEVRMGNVRAAVAAADEARRLCVDPARTTYAASAMVAEAIARGERGDPGAERRLADAEGVFLAHGAFPMVMLVELARGRLALAGERYGEAYLRLARMFDPGDASYHQFSGGWVLADLADAAVHGDGDLAYVASVVSDWRRIADRTQATHLLVQLGYADAVLADESDANDRFQELIAYSSADWPYYRARAQLAYGGWLRRRRRAADSRQPLREAAETFDALGVAVLAERARRELRASGETVPRRTPDTWDQLSPQELQIAQLAAAGLSNKEIGERLYLSHRTVGTHLYRLFPKLGVTSRTELSAALQVGTGAGRLAGD